MEEVLVVFRKLEQHNHSFREFVGHFANQASFDLFGMHFDNTTLTKRTTNQPT